jgi:hypothetical protein
LPKGTPCHGAVQQHDSMCMLLCKRVFPPWPADMTSARWQASPRRIAAAQLHVLLCKRVFLRWPADMTFD